jgi:hypothetical protein
LRFYRTRALVAEKGKVAVQLPNIHRPIPESVPVGHFEEGGIEVVDDVVSRAVYLDWIQRACAALGDGLKVRFYDHFEDEFDASVLDHLHEIRHLAIDGLPRVRHPEAVGRLPRLTSLTFGPRKVDPKMLAALGLHRLTHFTLAGTPTPALDLAPLADARSLRSLRLLGHGKNTEAIGNIASLSGAVLTNSSGVHAEKGSAFGAMTILMLNEGAPRHATNQRGHIWGATLSTSIQGKTVVILRGEPFINVVSPA